MLYVEYWDNCLLMILRVNRYSCNRYDEDEAKQARDAQEKSRAALQRYLFYCNRYMNHMQSLKFEHKLYASVKEKMEEMQQHNMSWIEVNSENIEKFSVLSRSSPLLIIYIVHFPISKRVSLAEFYPVDCFNIFT